MYQDYLKPVYKESYKSYTDFPANKLLNQRKRYKNPKTQKRKFKRNSHVGNMLNTRNDLQISKPMKTLEFESSSISKGVKGLLDNMELILPLVVLVGLSIFGISKYLDSKKAFDSGYAPEESGFNKKLKKYEGDDATTLIKNKIIEEATVQGVDPALALGLAEQESNFNPKAKSPTGAIGIYQMTTPACNQMKIPKDEKLYNADYNIHYGIGYLKWCLNAAKGNIKDALVIWNSGYGTWQKAKGNGQDLDTLNSMKTVSKSKGFTTLTMPRIDKYRNELSQLKEQSVTPIVKSTDAGKIRRIYSDEKETKYIDGYKLWNPVLHNGERYIDLSERAEAYLKDTGGKGIVTSGAEGAHANGKVSHASGNKIDIVSYDKSDEGWADTAIPFIKNKNTAFVNFEDFSTDRFQKIKKIIFSKITPDLITKCNQLQKYMNSKVAQPFLTRSHTGGGLHLDIGILPNAYSEDFAKKEETENAKRLKEQETILKEQEKLKKKQIEEQKRAEQQKSANQTALTIPKSTPPTNEGVADLGKVNYLQTLNKGNKASSKSKR